MIDLQKIMDTVDSMDSTVLELHLNKKDMKELKQKYSKFDNSKYKDLDLKNGNTFNVKIFESKSNKSIACISI
jgi:hypothetical protein